ncbi:MAG TPA: hypothetical protein VK487_09825 [Candidatus Bathyarchaeia archaeon]|nr:hypothetical protein [Candidatus Bathyarchaeia archaeon]
MRLTIRTKKIRPAIIIHLLKIIMTNINRPHQLATTQLTHTSSIFRRPLQLTIRTNTKPRNDMNTLRNLLVCGMPQFVTSRRKHRPTLINTTKPIMGNLNNPATTQTFLVTPSIRPLAVIRTSTPKTLLTIAR